MRAPGRKVQLASVLAAGLIAAAGLGGHVSFPAQAGSGAPAIHFGVYEPQKAVYHLTTGGGWFGREHTHLLTVLNNHMNAVGEGFLDLHIVMQGDGLDLLIAAKKDAKIAAAISRLKKSGAHFEICYNTLVQRHLDPGHDLFDVHREDIVAAGVAEVTALVSKGYVYLRL